MQRLPAHARTIDEVITYFCDRARQGLHEGWAWTGEITPLSEEGVIWGARTFTDDAAGARFQSLYVLHDHTGRGHFSRYIAVEPTPIVTAPSCAIEDFLTARKIPYAVAGRFTETVEYRAVTEFYGHRRAKRSRVHYMNHIDEGLGVLARLDAGDAAMRAYCLHPLVQMDEDLATHARRLPDLASTPYVATLALEYRNIANAHLSLREEQQPSAPIALSPLAEVNDMLRADKVQNYKDFLLHHGSHPRSAVLTRYFRRWLDRLEISTELFEELRGWLDVHGRVQLTSPISV